MKAIYKLIVLLLLLPFLWVDNSATFAQSAEINIGSTSGFIGTRVTIPVYLDAHGSFSMKTLLQGKFHFNPAKLKFRAISIAPGTLTFNKGWAVIAWPTAVPGEIEIQGVGNNPINHDGTLFFLHFDIIAGGAGSANVSGDLSDWKAFFQSGPFSAVNHGTIDYTHPVGASTVRGDANLDYKVDIDDVVAIIYHLYYGTPLFGQALLNADADLDFNVDIWDVIQINLYITLGHYNHNIQYIPNNSAVVQFDNAEYDNNIVQIPVEIGNAANVISAEVTLNYNPELISFEDFATDLTASGNFIHASEVSPGVAKFTYASYSLATEDFTAGKITLKFKNGISAGSITSKYKINDGEEKEGPAISFSPTDVTEDNIVPESFEVSQNYPNPFNPSTTIKFGLPEASFVSVKIFNSLGQEVKSLVNEQKSAGSHSINWNGDNNTGQKVTGGTYIYRVIAGDNVQSMKMVLLK